MTFSEKLKNLVLLISDKLFFTVKYQQKKKLLLVLSLNLQSKGMQREFLRVWLIIAVRCIARDWESQAPWLLMEYSGTLILVQGQSWYWWPSPVDYDSDTLEWLLSYNMYLLDDWCFDSHIFRGKCMTCSDLKKRTHTRGKGFMVG